MSFWADDVKAALGEIGVPVRFGTVTVQGRWRRKTVPSLEGPGSEVNPEDRSVLIPLASHPALAIGSAVTVDGTAYVVRDLIVESQIFKRLHLRIA